MKTAARATVVHLHGPTRAGYSFALGRYERQADVSQSRHVYTSVDGERALWWADGSWYVGSKDSVGQRAGFLSAKENTDVPEDVAVPWQYAAGANAWADSDVKCVTDEAHAAAVSAALTAAGDTIFLHGNTPADANAVCRGAYKRQPTEALTNDRHTYLFEDSACGPLLLWWSGGTWYVGAPADVGSTRGYLSVADDASLPESISATWSVAGSGGFVEAPELKCSLEAPPPDGGGATGVAVPSEPAAMHAFTVAVVQIVMAHDGPAGMGARAASAGALRQAFDTFDADRSGKLSAAELLHILTRQTGGGAALSLEDAMELIQHFDANGDGELDYDEFVRALTGSGAEEPPAAAADVRV